jgi:hypothetical protein
LATPEGAFYLNEHEIYDDPFEVIERYELGRFITPYGIGLDLGPEGFTWVYDVTDFRPLLEGAKRITAGNNQELLDLKFAMIEGTPPRDVVKVENLWRGTFNLSNMETTVPPMTVDLLPNATQFRLKTSASGHRFSNPTNCAEFCQKIHSIDINGNQRYNWQIIQECAMNPVYPQGGTWIFDRAGWCPGAKVARENWEITPFLTPNATDVVLDYNSESDPYGIYILETQLISYGSPNFALDAAIVDIISPSNTDEHDRRSLICGSPEIIIKNNGSENLTHLIITYGVVGGAPCYYLWEGDLSFLETEQVTLPPFNWNGYDIFDPQFFATASHPNYGDDQYEFNNSKQTPFRPTPYYEDGVVLWVSTNSAGGENSFRIYDEDGQVLYFRNSYSSNTLTKDTFLLDPGCYLLHFLDSDDDGLSFFANNDGNGYVRLGKLGVGFHELFEANFGKEIYHEFTIGHELGSGPVDRECVDITSIPEVATLPDELAVYPNPTTGIFRAEISLKEPQQVEMAIVNLYGQVVVLGKIMASQFTERTFDLSDQPAGIYFLTMKTEGDEFTRKLMLVK